MNPATQQLLEKIRWVETWLPRCRDLVEKITTFDYMDFEVRNSFCKENVTSKTKPWLWVRGDDMGWGEIHLPSGSQLKKMVDS